MAEQQRRTHVVTELLALFVGAFLIWTGLTENITWQRPLLITIGALNIIIDGWLLTTWKKQ